MTLNGLNGFFNQKTKNILMAAAILASAGFLSRLLGFLRNALLAYFYGAGDTLDAYFLAFRLPDFFFNLFFFGAFSAGFVPVFIKLKSENSEKAWKLASDVLNITLAVFIVFGAVFFISAPWILKFIAPGFEQSKLDLAVTLSRIMFLQPIFLGISVVFSGILQSTRRFLSYALAPIFYNFGIIFGILVLVPKLGPAGLAWGVVLGAWLHMIVQYPGAKSSGFNYRPVFSLKDNALKRIFHVIVPRSLSLILAQLNLVIMAGIASFLGSGRVSVFSFANDLNSLVLGVVAIPLGVAVFPVLSQAASRNNLSQMAEVVLKTLRQLLFVIIPAAALFFILRAQIVRLVLGYGKFDWVDTVLTIETLGFFLAGLVFQGIVAIVLRGFFAMEDAKTPFWILFFGVVLSLAVSLFLAPILDVSALALAMSASAFFNALALSWVFFKKIKYSVAELVKPVLIFIFGAAVAAAGAYSVLHFLDKYLDTHKVLHLIVQGGISGIVGIIIYLVLGSLFGLAEIKEIKKHLQIKKVVLPSLDEETHQ